MLLLDPPIVSLRLGLELGTDAIEEGKDVYFECKIKANPDIYKISWTHNVTFKLVMVQVKTCILQGNRIEERSSSEVSGLIMSGQSLVLQVKVKTNQRPETETFDCRVSSATRRAITRASSVTWRGTPSPMKFC